jgi:hypothetical protein
MPIYGRLSSHNQRFKELRRKKLERRENKISRNSLSSSHCDEKITENNFESIDPKKLESIEIEIRKKAKTQLKNELYTILLSIILTCGLIYFLFFH